MFCVCLCVCILRAPWTFGWFRKSNESHNCQVPMSLFKRIAPRQREPLPKKPEHWVEVVFFSGFWKLGVVPAVWGGRWCDYLWHAAREDRLPRGARLLLQSGLRYLAQKWWPEMTCWFLLVWYLVPILITWDCLGFPCCWGCFLLPMFDISF